MKRNWFVLAACLALGLGLGVTAVSRSADDDETPLGKIMEKVQKHKATITKGVRNVASYKKSQEDIEKSAKEWSKLAKESKPLNDAVKAAKNQPEPQKKWDELMDLWGKESDKLAELAAKADSTQKDAKDQLNTINKTCTECHQVFRVDAEADKF
ncbi:cytochrome c [Paludisphaera mucosa]|uniref:Cytochrome c n=1 Tax=Paludisphaera mucosa TaxID=3030827 RepID=A0ABT6FC52_9BACT|nr:cytochrome c [Paludisphaera mucosa]MDG3005167.1 cytochrome c [Paludisphaera mucosa]